MIFIALGTQKFQLNRLLLKVDNLIEEGIIEEPVFAQRGYSTYIPRNFETDSLMSQKKFDRLVNECDMLITHCGVGTILIGVNLKKHIIVYPRLAKYGEHVDDHQVEIAEAFESMGIVTYCREHDSLEEKIKEAYTVTPASFQSNKKEHLRVIREFIEKELKKK